MSSENSTSKKTDNGNIIKAILYIAFIIIAMSAIWFVPRIALGIDTPFLSVSGPSMNPTLVEGDYIIIKATPFDTLNKGDIIVFHSPIKYDDLIVHRIYDIISQSEEKVLVTKGDNTVTNPVPDPWYVTENEYLGQYVGVKIPYLGYIALLFPEPINYLFLIVILLIIFFIEFYPSEKKKSNEESVLPSGSINYLFSLMDNLYIQIKNIRYIIFNHSLFK